MDNLIGSMALFEPESQERLIMNFRPQNVTTMNGAQLATAIAAIPADVTSLDLGWNSLHNKTAEELQTAFAAIPASVTSLDLSWNNLYERAAEELKTAFAAIPASVTSLNLSENNFHNKTAAYLATAFAAIPASVTSLNLSGNYLHFKSGADLAIAFKAIPASITSLNLSNNRLHLKTAEELKTAFAAIPASVTSLNLSNNGLANKAGPDYLSTVFAAIPAGVASLDFSRHSLRSKTAEQLAFMAGSLQHITTIVLELSDIEAMTVDQRRALKNIFPRIKARDIILLDNEGNRLPAGRAELAVSLFREVPSLQALSAHCFLTRPQPGAQASPCLGNFVVTEPVGRYLKTF